MFIYYSLFDRMDGVYPHFLAYPPFRLSLIFIKILLYSRYFTTFAQRYLIQ